LFKNRLTVISKTVVTNRIWLKSTKSRQCDILIAFATNIKYETIHKVLDQILRANLIVYVKYHKTTHNVAFYITASYEQFLKGAEELELKKPIKQIYGGGVKEFIFEEQEFFDNIENEDLFLTTEEKQTIINLILNKIECDNDVDVIDLEGKKIPHGRKLSKLNSN
jgi:anoctamin-8